MKGDNDSNCVLYQEGKCSCLEKEVGKRWMDRFCIQEGFNIDYKNKYGNSYCPFLLKYVLNDGK